MSAARLLAAGMVIAACAIFCRVRRLENSERLQNTEHLQCDISMLADLIGSERVSLPEASERLSQSGRLNKLWADISYGMSNGMTFYQAYDSSKLPPLTTPAKAELSKLARMLGGSDVHSETERIRDSELRLKEMLTDIKKHGKEKERLVSALPMLLGIAAAILII